MTPNAIATTYAYRHKVAQACAQGSKISRIAYLAFSTDATQYTLDDTELVGEFIRLPADITVQNVLLTARATLTGAQVGERVLRGVAAFTEDGTLVGRHVLAPKEFEPQTEMDFELVFQY